MVLTPVGLGGLRLRNRLIRAGCYEGLAMSTVGYCAVSADGRAYTDQLLARAELLPGLRRLVQAVHGGGAAACLQLVHCGFFASPGVIGRRPLGASRKLCLYRGAVGVEMRPRISPPPPGWPGRPASRPGTATC